jgi:hypothetical protein
LEGKDVEGINTGHMGVLIRISDSEAEGIHDSRVIVAGNMTERLCGLVVRVLGYRSGGPGSIPDTTRKKRVVGLERGPLSFVCTTEELLDRKVAVPV